MPVAVLCLLAAVLGVAVASPRSVGGLPFVVHEAVGPVLEARSPRGFASGWTLADTDGDGHQDLVFNRPAGVELQRHDGIAHYPVDQLNLPPGYHGDVFPYLFMVPYDADGDGADEVAMTAVAVDHSHWRLWVGDVEGQQFLADITLPIFPERLEDGAWDGYYLPIGELAMPDRPRPALILACLVLHDVNGRGVMAIDPVDGVVLWRRLMDAQVGGYTTDIVDLEGDGYPEVLVSSSAPNNLKGERLHGASDDSSRVFVIENDGELRWQHALGGPASSAFAVAIDLDGDGRLEVVGSMDGSRAPRGRLVVWSADGRRLAGGADAAVQYRFLRAARMPGTGEPRVLVLERSDQLLALRWTGAELQPVARRQVGMALLQLVDAIDQVPGPELVVVNPGRVELFDLDLRPLAAFATASDQQRPSVFAWRPRPDVNLFFAPDGVNGPVNFARAPSTAHPAWFVGGGAAVLGLVGLGWQRVRQRRLSRVVETDPVILRELRLQLLARLQKGGHEKIGALAALRRLAWRLEAEAVREQQDPTGRPSVQSRERVAAAVAVFDDETRPRLEEVLILGRRTGVPAHQLAVGQELLGDLTAALAAARADDVEHASLHRRVSGLAEEAEAALQRLRRHVEGHFACDLAATVQRVLEAQSEALSAHGIDVVVDRRSTPAGPLVAVDVLDLEFVLDNLVGNAIRAMADTGERRLTIEWSESSGRVTATVTDTGCGIAPDDRQAIFDEGRSSRQGGGYGLARSRRELGIYGGTLRVLRSEPGQGTTFVLMLPVASDPDLVNHSDQ